MLAVDDLKPQTTPQERLYNLLTAINQRGYIKEQEYSPLIDCTNQTLSPDLWEANEITLMISTCLKYMDGLLKKFIEAVKLPCNVVTFVKLNEQVLKDHYQDYWKNLCEQERIQRLYLGKYIAYEILVWHNIITCFRAINNNNNAREIFPSLEDTRVHIKGLKTFYEAFCQKNENEDKEVCNLIGRLLDQLDTLARELFENPIENYQVIKQSYINAVQKAIGLQGQKN